jgi:hypothetical protein
MTERLPGSATLVPPTASAVDRSEERIMRHRVRTSAAVALAVAATTVPFAHAANSDAGNKSDYPELFSHATDIDDGYKSGYPQLHAIHTYKAWASRTAGSDDDPTPGFSRLHAQGSGPPASQIQSADRAFHWSDAALGAGTAALAIFLAAAGALALSRHRRIAV